MGVASAVASAIPQPAAVKTRGRRAGWRVPVVHGLQRQAPQSREALGGLEGYRLINRIGFKSHLFSSCFLLASLAQPGPGA